MKKRICIMAIILATWVTYAQTNVSTLKGKVIDANSKTALQYITVSIHRLDSTIVAGSITDEKGSFYIESIPFGKHFLKASKKRNVGNQEEASRVGGSSGIGK